MDTLQRFDRSNKLHLTLMITAVVVALLTLASVAIYLLVRTFSPYSFSRKLTASEKKKGAVASNGKYCADVGKDILLENGTAVDAAIAVAICEGVMCFQSMGIGGGFLMTVFQKRSGKVEVLNARETAPQKSNPKFYKEKEDSTIRGGLSVGVPGEIKGYQEAYLKYGGGVPWRRLFTPSILICSKGFPIDSYLASHIERYKTEILSSSTLRSILWLPEKSRLIREGEILRRPLLALFLKDISIRGADAFYRGRHAEDIVREIKEAGGLITKADLIAYRPVWMKPVKMEWNDYTFFTTPIPGSGTILAFLLNVLKQMPPDKSEVITYQRITEAFKWAYGKRTELGDNSMKHFVPTSQYIEYMVEQLKSFSFARSVRSKIKDNETSRDPSFYGARVLPPRHGGTCHISVLAPNGDAVALTSSINLVFGAKFASRSKHFIYNNVMGDFSFNNIINPFNLPPSPANLLVPKKRPLSSMCPSIFLNKKKEVALIIGASGGTRITSTVAYIAYKYFIEKMTLQDAIQSYRIHNQLFPMEVDYELGFDEKIIRKLEKIGHVSKGTPMTQTSAATAIGQIEDQVVAHFDLRRGGSAVVFEKNMTIT